MKIEELEKFARKIREYIITMNYHAGSGHPGGSLSAVEMMTWLFHVEMNFTLDNYKSPGRDRFVLSKGHSCLVLYAILAQKGFFDVREFENLRQVGGMLQGHPDRLKTPGVEFNSGSLGQGFSFALGCALGGKRSNKNFNVYSILGDGELNEGQIWEGFMFGAFHRLNNMVAMVDYNKYQSDDLNDNITSLSPLMDKFKAFGWHAIEIDGHDFKEIHKAFEEARKESEKPTVILAHTVKGKGISFMENNPKWHGSICPDSEEKACALMELHDEVKSGEIL